MVAHRILTRQFSVKKGALALRKESIYMGIFLLVDFMREWPKQ